MIKKWGNEGPIDLAGYATVSTSTLYVTYACGSLVLLLFSGATGTIFWIIGMYTCKKVRVFVFTKQLNRCKCIIGAWTCCTDGTWS